MTSLKVHLYNSKEIQRLSLDQSKVTHVHSKEIKKLGHDQSKSTLVQDQRDAEAKS